MAYSQSEIENLERAMARGVLTVEYDGQKVTYRSLAEMERQLATMKAGQGDATLAPRFSNTIFDRR